MGGHNTESEIEAVGPRVLRRNWRFSLIPKITLYLLLVILVWEIVRQNSCVGAETCRAEGLWSITLLGVGPSATLCGVFATLVLTREQFARLMRPNLMWTSHRDESGVLGRSAWTARLLNAGPGIVRIKRVTYSLSVLTPIGMRHRTNATHGEAIALLNEAGLVEHSDYHLELMTSGASLPVVKQRSEGTEFAAFTDESLVPIRNLVFILVTVDTMGDTHIGSLPFKATLPEAVRNVRPSTAIM